MKPGSRSASAAPRAPRLLIMLVLGLICAHAAGARGASLEPFFGSYVGVAEVANLAGGEVRQRDMDIVIEPYKEGGFRIHWVNVTLVDGQRAVPGVERRVQTVLFEPAEEHDYFVEVQAANMFRERAETSPMRGDPVRWASLDDQGLHVYSFLVLADGRYELQIYDRALTDIGLDIRFQRIVDGEVVRRITGSTARANLPPEELATE